MKLLWYRFLDFFQSFIRRKTKEAAGKQRWGPIWRDMTRPGRRLSRVYLDDVDVSADPERGLGWKMRPDPGWEWTCPNCREYSIITESMMPAILKDWEADTERMTERAKAKGVKYTLTPRPTAATAGCTNCKYRPGAPE